jgi:hypothetical protein
MKNREPAWWPPKAGDKLRTHAQREIDGKLTLVHALIHVVSVFDHDRETLATVAEWWPTKQRWNYKVIHGWLDAHEDYWPDGQSAPRPWTNPDCGCVPNAVKENTP